jgi:ABC-type nitrate/sulfonate/bicarbonate transport system substrate-binding protein
LNIGFVPLIDAAPLIVAFELGYFVDEGLHVALNRQIGWGNVRDKLTFGQLDASHALLGMPPLSMLGKEMFVEPLVAIAGLGAGGNAITLSRRLTNIGVNSAVKLHEHIRRRQGKPLVFAHVFSCSTHHYLLREWLAAADIQPDKDVHLCVLPPPQMVRQLAKGLLDGFCVGDPWNVLAEKDQQGVIVAATTDLYPDHPEKVLAVSRKWLERNFDAATGLVRAVVRACEFCQDPENWVRVSRIISGVRYLDQSAELIAKSLAFNMPGSRNRFRDWSPATLAPKAAHVEWILKQMIRWGHLSREADVASVASSCVDSAAYEAALKSMPSTRSSIQTIPEGVR